MPGRFHAILRRRLQSCKNNYSTVEEIVEHLLSTYPDYSRQRLQPFTVNVRKALESSPPPPSPASKKQKHQNQLQQRHQSPPR
ncbi:hypothetical protein CRG98_034601, partial [Punica granatum]